MTAPAPSSPLPQAQAQKAVWSSLVGTTLEWYDFFLFGTAAALIFDEQFFAAGDPTTAALSAFATLAVGFIARPVGGVLFGRMGDRIGRRKTMMATIILIGVVTGFIGLLPTYDSIGLWAAGALTALRFVQGLALGGEWAGAIVMTSEHAPPEKRAFYTALPLLGSPCGTLVSSGAFLLAHQLSAENFASWGWRVPFLFAFVLLFVALIARSAMEESPVFVALHEAENIADSPIFTVLRTAWRHVLVGAMASLIGTAGFFLVTTFVISYSKRIHHMPAHILLVGSLLAAAGEIFIIIGFGRLALRTGVTAIAVGGSIACVILAFPLFWMVEAGDPVVTIIAMIVGVAALSTPYAVCGTIMASLFPDTLRYTGVALAANTAAIVSGFVPFVATWFLTLSDGKNWSSSLLFLVLSVVTLVGALAAPRLPKVFPQKITH